MADEAVIKDRTNGPINFTVTNATAIEKGAILKNTDNRVAIINSAQGDVIAGINGREKIASDGRTSTPVFRRGVFLLICSGAVTTGDTVAISSTVNRVWPAPAATKSGSIIGVALEDGTNGNGIHVDVNVGAGGQTN